MKKTALLAFVTVLFGAALTLRAGADQKTSVSNAMKPMPSRASAGIAAAHEAAAMSSAAVNETLQKFCGDCHNDDDLKGEMSLDGFDAAKAGSKAAQAEKIVMKLR